MIINLFKYLFTFLFSRNIVISVLFDIEIIKLIHFIFTSYLEIYLLIILHLLVIIPKKSPKFLGTKGRFIFFSKMSFPNIYFD